MFLLKEILFLVTITFALGYPANDLNLPDAKEPLLDVSEDFAKRGAVRQSRHKWPTSQEDGKTIVKIPYIVDGGLDSQAKSELERAIQDLHLATCVRFHPRSGEQDYVSFKNGAGCSSQIGKRVGKQAVYLGSGCEYKGTVLHELIHLLVFYHEHNRADRDTYLRIHEENTDPNYRESVMVKYGADKMENLGFAYDLHSIMQYGKTAFAKSPGLITVEARSNPNMELGNRNAMSADDVMKINKLYHCAERSDVYKNVEVTVQTGDGWWDGTDSFLYLELIGDNGRMSGESNVEKGGHYDDFESDKTDHYLVAFKDVGAIRQLRVRLQENPNGSYFDGWTFEKITVKDGDKTYSFSERDVSPNESVTVQAS